MLYLLLVLLLLLLLLQSVLFKVFLLLLLAIFLSSSRPGQGKVFAERRVAWRGLFRSLADVVGTPRPFFQNVRGLLCYCVILSGLIRGYSRVSGNDYTGGDPRMVVLAQF